MNKKLNIIILTLLTLTIIPTSYSVELSTREVADLFDRLEDLEDQISILERNSIITPECVPEIITRDMGFSATITYAAIAVALIAIIGAAVLYTREAQL